MQFAWRAFCVALANAGSNSAARMAMMAMTTSNSMRVNAARFRAVTVGLDMGTHSFNPADPGSFPFNPQPTSWALLHSGVGWQRRNPNWQPRNPKPENRISNRPGKAPAFRIKPFSGFGSRPAPTDLVSRPGHPAGASFPALHRARFGFR